LKLSLGEKEDFDLAQPDIFCALVPYGNLLLNIQYPKKIIFDHAQKKYIRRTT